jgi:hypothetical protein
MYIVVNYKSNIVFNILLVVTETQQLQSRLLDILGAHAHTGACRRWIIFYNTRN